MRLRRAVANIPENMHQQGSLTRLLKACCDDFTIRPQTEGALSSHRYYRESLLLNNDKVLIWAYSHLHSQQQSTVDRFCGLQQGSLGERVLFVEPSIRRSRLQFYSVDQLPARYVSMAAGQALYGRFSRSSWQQQTLSLFEVFFPEAHRALAHSG